MKFEDFRINWLVVAPTVDVPYFKIVTAGMSDRQMPLLENDDPACSERYAEVMFLLPLTWKLDNKSLQKEEFSWPFDMLNQVSIFTYQFNTRIGVGHTITNGLEQEPYSSSTKLSGCLLAPAISVPSEFVQLKINEEKTVVFLNLYPLYKEEMQYKLDHGMSKLLELFEKHNVLDNISPKRKNVVKKKWFFF